MFPCFSFCTGDSQQATEGGSGLPSSGCVEGGGRALHLAQPDAQVQFEEVWGSSRKDRPRIFCASVHLRHVCCRGVDAALLRARAPFHDSRVILIGLGSYRVWSRSFSKH